jgi:hypothetical protein
MHLSLIPNPLHIFEQHLLSPSTVQFGGPTVGVAGDSLGGFKRAVIFQKIRDAGGLGAKTFCNHAKRRNDA